MDSIKNIVNDVASFSGGSAWILVGALAAVGTITMAVLQIVKQVSPVRRWFQRYRIESWIGQPKKPAQPPSKETATDPRLTTDMLVGLATGGQYDALFNLPIEQLVAQMSAAGQMALEYPKRYRPLLSALCVGAEDDDLAAVEEGPLGTPASGKPTYLDARNRISHRLQRNLDGLQIAIGDRWQLWLQIMSIAASIAIVELAIYLSGSTNPSDYLIGIPLGLIGGDLAPVTHDLVTALQSLQAKH